MAELKREYVIPLRRKTMTVPKWRRTKKAVSVLKDFVRKHMKTDDVVVCPELNEHLWQRGIKHPPGKVSVIATKIQVGSEEKTIVNLIEVGVEKYVEAYKAAATQVPSKEKAEKPAKEDAKVEEKVDSVEEKEEEKKAEPEKAEPEKKEEVKNE